MTYLKSKKTFLVFHSAFWCLEGGGVENQTPHHLLYIFNPLEVGGVETQTPHHLLYIFNPSAIAHK